MSWAKGQSGNPGGQSREKPFSDALRVALSKEDPKTKRKNLLLVADKLVECALEGESWAIQQVADRLDGKPAQETNMTIEKRDATDWTLTELVALVHDVRADRERNSAPGGS